MPIYEYQCQGCEHEFETIQKISDPPLTECPSCGKRLLKKKISAVAFRLKGGGWYETDFKSGDKKNVASSGDGGESSGDSSKNSDSSKSEAKTETKSASSESAAKSSSSDGGKDGSKKNEKTPSPKTSPKREPKGSD
jgi:putative FmdB family regulatory protein